MQARAEKVIYRNLNVHTVCMKLSVREAPTLHPTGNMRVYVKSELFPYPTKLCCLEGILKSGHCCKRHWNTALPLPEKQTKTYLDIFHISEPPGENKQSGSGWNSTAHYYIHIYNIHSCFGWDAWKPKYLQYMVGLSQNTSLIRWKVHHTIWSVKKKKKPQYQLHSG